MSENEFVRNKSRKILFYILNKNEEECKNYRLNLELLETCRIQCENNDIEEKESLQKLHLIGRVNAQKAEIDDIIQAIQNTCCLNDCVSKECY